MKGQRDLHTNPSGGSGAYDEAMLGLVQLRQAARDIGQADTRVVLEAPAFRQSDPVIFDLDAEPAVHAASAYIYVAGPQQRACAVTDGIFDDRLQDEARHERVTGSVLDPNVDRQPILE